ncbi:MAG: ATP-binding protein [Prevotella sp.]|nr:ATP-binding protein [Prevotella sp.]
MRKQLEAWKSSLKDCGGTPSRVPRSWLEAFDQLKELINKSREKKKVIFIDEMPWIDTKRSDFVPALEHFWNGWASARKDILLIVCGSATSWIINKIIKDHGGLHNRVTHKIHLHQFTLKECEQYSRQLKLGMTKKQLMECYMVMGGVPYYWSFLDRSISFAQNIDNMFFAEDAPLRGEFDELYSSLFRNPEPYIHVIDTLGKKLSGMTREELKENGKLSANGNLTKILEDLEYCGFIRRYNNLGNTSHRSVYQLIDSYTLFYYMYVKVNKHRDRHFWSKNLGTPQHNTWCGLAFERVCLLHIDQIKRALSIAGIMSSEFSWRSQKTESRGAQIDLLIDRSDDVIDVCEMKYYAEEYAFNQDEYSKLQNRMLRLAEETKTRKAVQAILITTYGLKQNEYSDIVQSVVTMNDLFLD